MLFHRFHHSTDSPLEGKRAAGLTLTLEIIEAPGVLGG